LWRAWRRMVAEIIWPRPWWISNTPGG
jgi:hypothetical protein